MVSKPLAIRLRDPSPEDVDARAALGTSAEIIRMYGYLTNTSSSVMARDKALGWFESLRNHPCAWVIEADGALVGEARIDNINEADHRGRLAIGLFNEKFLGRGIGRKAINLVLRQAFGPLQLHRVDLRVLSYNIRAIRCYESCGFIRDWIMAILEREFHARCGTCETEK